MSLQYVLTHNRKISKHVKILCALYRKKMIWTTVRYINKVHKEFINNFLRAAQLDDRVESSIPTFMFLTFTFILIHRALHRHSNYIPSLQLHFYRELGFQWSYFYATRIWFLSIKGMHWINRWFEYYLRVQHQENKVLWIEHIYIRVGLLTILTFIGLIPCAVFVVNCFWKHTIPNFLMWVGEDPWIRSEIGISGHYLERPPNFMTPKRKEYAYRAKRSISVECDTNNPKMKEPPRNCKSLAVISYS
ncbi:hypothetical protein ILUMI_25258 [Ignelater luminosus]|uniref:Uncharacterized protein n=1 Tax=Ignelater luminosus TaxID=2038154 RepID=A0A8K0C5U0_IGNLU|nr:hypothetical protein ILUMI_25258 [Ignelater luminosus]